MKTRLNYYKCKKCNWKGSQAYGSGGLTWTKEGVVAHHTAYHCPLCGSKELEYKSEMVDLVLMNACS